MSTIMDRPPENSNTIRVMRGCRPREGGDPYSRWWLWVPAFAGTTIERLPLLRRLRFGHTHQLGDLALPNDLRADIRLVFLRRVVGRGRHRHAEIAHALLEQISLHNCVELLVEIVDDRLRGLGRRCEPDKTAEVDLVAKLRKGRHV